MSHHPLYVEPTESEEHKRLSAVERTLGGYSDIMTQILNKYQTVTESLERCEKKYDTILQKMEAFTKAK